MIVCWHFRLVAIFGNPRCLVCTSYDYVRQGYGRHYKNQFETYFLEIEIIFGRGCRQLYRCLADYKELIDFGSDRLRPKLADSICLFVCSFV